MVTGAWKKVPWEQQADCVDTMEETCEESRADSEEILPLHDPRSEGVGREDAHRYEQYNSIQVVMGDVPYTVEGMQKRVAFAKQQGASLDGRRHYECDLCGRCFSDPSNLRRHKNIHTGQRPYSCEICGNTFRQKSQLDRHQFVHTGERPFQCAFCPKGFRDSTELKVHYRVHTGERPYQCESCPRSFSRIGYLKKHQETHDMPEETVILEEPKHMEISSSVTEKVSVPGKFQCSFCGLCFYSKNMLTAHRPKHYKIGPAGQKLYECEECKKCFNNSSNLRKHAIIHTGLKPFTCTVCDQCFRQATHLERHNLIHTGERPFKCSVCQKGFRDTSDLQKHQRVHTGEKPYQCPVCEKSFKHHHNARVHRQRHLSEGIPPLLLPSLPRSPHPGSPSSPGQKSHVVQVKCLRCNVELGTQCQVQTHHCKAALSIHKTRQKARKCSICAKTFTHITALRRHYLTHTAHRPFSCHLCDKTFRQLSRLQRHMQSHTAEFSFQCTICQKTFQESGDLTRHHQAHTRARVLKCQLCDKTYSQLRFLKAHLLTHEQEPSLGPKDVEEVVIKVEDGLSPPLKLEERDGNCL